MLEATKILVKAQLVVRLRRTTEARESSLIWDEAGGGTKQGGKNILALQTQTSLHATAGGKKKNTQCCYCKAWRKEKMHTFVRAWVFISRCDLWKCRLPKSTRHQ